MIEQPTENVKLTFEQLQQIDVTEKKLANLQNEIGIASKNLRVTNLDVEKAIKARDYHEKLLAELEVQLKDKNKQSKDLDKDIEGKTKELHKIYGEVDRTTEKHQSKIKELKDREEVISSKEKEQNDRQQKLQKDSDKLEIKESEHKIKVAKLKEAIKDL